MDSSQFDLLTRHFAKATQPLTASTDHLSRRSVFRRALAGAIGAAVTPAASLAAIEPCAGRVQRPGYTPRMNGCGPSGFGWAIPDKYGRAKFTNACNLHDLCYGTCNKNKAHCDVRMRQGMVAICRSAYPGKTNKKKRLKCTDRARTYYKTVQKRGQSAYEKAQDEACMCCLPSEPKCGYSCCATSACRKCVRGVCKDTCPRGEYCDNAGVCKDPCAGGGCGM